MWRSLALACVALLTLAWAFARLQPGSAALGTARTCARAQLIEGQLRCDEELLHDLAEHCSSLPAGNLGPGDALAPGACMCPVAHAWGCATPGRTRMPAEQLAALAQMVDINGASLEELASLPGIGPKLAASIVAGRPYRTLDDLLEVSGIGPKRLAAMRSRIALDSGGE